MTRRDIITGTLDNLFLDIPYTLDRDDETTSLRLQGKGLDALDRIERQLRERHGSITPEVIVRESDSIARELRPYLQANAEATFRGAAHVADAVSRGSERVSGEVRESADRIVHAVDSLEDTVESGNREVVRSVSSVESAVYVAGRETVAAREAITGIYDARINAYGRNAILEPHKEEILKLYKAGVVSKEVFVTAAHSSMPDSNIKSCLLQAVIQNRQLDKNGEVLIRVRRMGRNKYFVETKKIGHREYPPIYHDEQQFDPATSEKLFKEVELTASEIQTLDTLVEIIDAPVKSLKELLSSGEISIQCLAVLHDSNLLPKELQAALYESGVFKPKLGTLADLGISLRRSTNYLASIEQNTARKDRHLAGIHERNGQMVKAQLVTAGLMGMAVKGIHATNVALKGIHATNVALDRLHEQGEEAQVVRSRIADAVEGSEFLLEGIYQQGEVAQTTREEILDETREGNRRLGLLYEQGEQAQDTREAILGVTVRAEQARAISARRSELLLGELIRNQAETLDVSIESRELLRDLLGGVADLTDELGRGIEVIGSGIAMTRIKVVGAIRELSELGGIFHQEAQEVRLKQLAVLEQIRDAVGTTEYMKVYAQRFKEAEEFKAAGLIDEAIESYEEAFKQFKGDHKLTYQIALIREKNGQHEEAIKMLDKCEKLAKDNKTKAYYKLVAAFIFVKIGDLKKAGEFATEASKLDPENPDIHFSRAIICLRNGNKVEAAKSLLKALTIDETMIFKIMGQNEFNPFGDDIVEDVYGPFVQGTEGLSLEVLYILTFAIEELEEKIDEKVKTKLKVLWKRKLKEIFKKHPSELVTSKYLEDFTGTTNRGLVLEVTKELVEEGDLKFENADDYFFLAGLYSAVEANRKTKLYELLANGLTADKRANDENKFAELTEHLKVIFGEQASKLLRVIASQALDRKFEKYKNYLKQVSYET